MTSINSLLTSNVLLYRTLILIMLSIPMGEEKGPNDDGLFVVWSLYLSGIIRLVFLRLRYLVQKLNLDFVILQIRFGG